MNICIQADRITKSYLRKDGTFHHILVDFSICFEKGKIYGIAGLSGRGKTTLLSILAGCEEADTGKVVYKRKDGQEISPLLARLNQEIVYIPQRGSDIPELSVEENIEAALLLKGLESVSARQHEKEYWLKAFEIYTLKDSFPAFLSAGQRQRLALAWACSVAPNFLLLDETTAHLDKRGVKNCLKIFEQFVYTEDRGIIIVSHDPFVLEECDEVIEL